MERMRGQTVLPGLHKWKFVPATLTDTQDSLNCVMRGWYGLYRIDISCHFDSCYFDTTFCMNDGLVLLEVILTAYRQGPIDNAGLEELQRAFDYFKKKDVHIILRFLYDVEGKSLELEPSKLSIIKEHMSQVGPVVYKNRSCIYVVQGLFVGNWGEMHGSRFLSKNYIIQLYDSWHEAAGEYVPLALRRPDYIRYVLPQSDYKAGIYHNLTIYDDAMFASYDDLGTFGLDSDSFVYDSVMGRAKELEFLAPMTALIPCGGEAVGGEISDPTAIINDMRMLHVSYLNREHDIQLLNKWKRVIVPSNISSTTMSLYEYVEKHMGYRFYVKSVSYNRKSGFTLVIDNKGFGNYMGPEKASVVLSNLEYTFNYKIQTPAREWISGQDTIISTGPIGKLPDGQYHVSLILPVLNGRKSIEFSNAGNHACVELGTFINKI